MRKNKKDGFASCYDIIHFGSISIGYASILRVEVLGLRHSLIWTKKFGPDNI